jgi:hypothetical protein
MTTIWADARSSRWVIIAGIWLAMVLVLDALTLPKACGQWGPYTPPDLASITSQTETGPDPRTRLILGLGEKVKCMINPDSWTDKDCYADTEVDDTIGTRSWQANTWSQTWPQSGDEVWVIADRRPYMCVATITVDDSNTKGDDAPITRSITFEVVEPGGILAEKYADIGFVPVIYGIHYVGSFTAFKLTILPTSVSFKNLEIAENIPEHEWTWPNGDPQTFGPEWISTTVGAGNVVYDLCKMYAPVECFFSEGMFLDTYVQITMTDDYVNFDQMPVKWYDSNVHTHEFEDFGNQLYQSRAVIQVDNTAQGDWMGPWEYAD